MRDQVIAWDSCVLLDAIQGTPGRYDAIAPMINLGLRGDLKVVLSAMSYAETYFLRHLAQQGVGQDEQSDLIEQWLESDYLIKRAVDFGTSKIAGELCRQFRGKLQPPDAIIVATALRHGASALITYDNTAGKSLLACDGLIRTEGGALRICRPEAWNSDNSPQLFDQAIHKD